MSRGGVGEDTVTGVGGTGAHVLTHARVALVVVAAHAAPAGCTLGEPQTPHWRAVCDGQALAAASRGQLRLRPRSLGERSGRAFQGIPGIILNPNGYGCGPHCDGAAATTRTPTTTRNRVKMWPIYQG